MRVSKCITAFLDPYAALVSAATTRQRRVMSGALYERLDHTDAPHPSVPVILREPEKKETWLDMAQYLPEDCGE